MEIFPKIIQQSDSDQGGREYLGITYIMNVDKDEVDAILKGRYRSGSAGRLNAARLKESRSDRHLFVTGKQPEG